MTDYPFGEEHVRLYRETGGATGHEWREGSTILLLTTKGRKTGLDRTVPLIYDLDGANPVIVASKGGAPEHPEWFHNFVAHPEVDLQDGPVKKSYRAEIVEGAEREDLWQLAVDTWSTYASYQEKTDRQIPVFKLTPID